MAPMTSGCRTARAYHVSLPSSRLRDAERELAPRPAAGDPGRRGGVATHSSKRRSLHDGSELGSGGYVSSVDLAAGCGAWGAVTALREGPQWGRVQCPPASEELRLPASAWRYPADASRGVVLGCEGVAVRHARSVGGDGRSAIPLQMSGSAYGIRTRVTAVRGRRPRPLDECATQVGLLLCSVSPSRPEQRIGCGTRIRISVPRSRAACPAAGRCRSGSGELG